MTKQILYNRRLDQSTGKLVFEFNGIKGYTSEYRTIKLENDFVFKNNLYEANEDNTFFPTNFSDLNFTFFSPPRRRAPLEGVNKP